MRPKHRYVLSTIEISIFRPIAGRTGKMFSMSVSMVTTNMASLAGQDLPEPEGCPLAEPCMSKTP
jgi:hypothetical protein